MAASASVSRYERTVGRYMLFGAIGSGGMATVHLGRRVGAGGFARLVAIKRLHPHLAADREVVNSFLDEARVAVRITHPNVVSIHDVVLAGEEVLLVMDYVPGCSLATLAAAERRAGRAVPPAIAMAIVLDLLRGLQAAHDARDERGRSLRLVHRDVSPHNLLVGSDGVARVLDFGIAKALGRLHETATGAIKGKLAYMAPERLRDEEPTASVDVYAAAIIAWEMLAGARYFGGPSDATMIPRVTAAEYRHLEAPALAAVDAVLARALERDACGRYASAATLAAALLGAAPTAGPEDVADWVEQIAGEELAQRAEEVETVEQTSVPSSAPLSSQGVPSDAAPTVREGAVPTAATEATELGDTSAPVVSHARPREDAHKSAVRWLALALAALTGTGVVAFTRGRAGAHASTPPPSSATVASPLVTTAEPIGTAVIAPPVPTSPASAGRAPPASMPGRPRLAPRSSASASPRIAPSASAGDPPVGLEAPLDRK